MCVCVCLNNPVSLPAEPAAKHAGSSGGCPSLLCLCVFLGCDWLPESPADCTLSLRRRERQADGGERDGVSCHFLSLSSIPPSFFLLCICQGRGGGREEVGGGRAEGGWRFGGEFLSLCCCRSPEDLIHPLCCRRGGGGGGGRGGGR